jgi:Fe-S cluster biogenesis protein NfuA
MNTKIEVFYEATPNPQAMKFNLGAIVADESAFFEDPARTQRSPLAQKIFGFPWAKAVMVTPTSITITKQDWVDWTVLADPLSDLISEHLASGEGVLFSAAEFQDPENIDAETAAGAEILETDEPVVKKIKIILNRDVRPAVAMDGGDIVFSRYENNRLYLQMRGACSGCPSSAITLKDGIETRMKQEIPELIEVISV